MTVSQEKFEGSRSLKVVFRGFAKPVFYNIAQVVTVQPLQRYRLSFMLRTDNLRSTSMPFIEVAALKTFQRLASTEPFNIGSEDWHQVAIEFEVPAGVEGIDVRTLRVGCGEDCPINGTLWYDDFRLTLL